MSCATLARISYLAMFFMGPQVCTASLLVKHHHHKHKAQKDIQADPSKVDKLIASQEEEQKANAPDPNDPNDFGLMDKATLDAEFPTTGDMFHAKSVSGIFDLRAGH